jgi:hypothetical protein
MDCLVAVATKIWSSDSKVNATQIFDEEKRERKN